MKKFIIVMYIMVLGISAFAYTPKKYYKKTLDNGIVAVIVTTECDPKIYGNECSKIILYQTCYELFTNMAKVYVACAFLKNVDFDEEERLVLSASGVYDQLEFLKHSVQFFEECETYEEWEKTIKDWLNKVIK